ncbi:hypothetical protein AVEN_91268-1 [Araneus ventricosus]|uniref:MATH domain-containing protein n=1 Tax=Araneus ventricosus TaxID=182803 RepID=A0A4Y2ETN5_ARAVE|nr:hypothetical protein AVEN_91268-1 [Araneus ventricosus]
MSYSSMKLKEKIVSPSFVVDEMNGIVWSIRLYPRGKDIDSRYFIAVYLHSEDDNNPAVTMKVIYDIPFIGKDSYVLVSRKRQYDFGKCKGYGFPEFAKREEVYDTERSIFLHQDTLTVRCRIWKEGESISQEVRYFARTRIGVEKRYFLWNLQEFSTLKPEKKCTYLIKSPKNDEQIMSVDLFVTAGVNCDEIIRFELFPNDKTIKYSTFRLSLVDASGNKVECNQEELWFDEESECEKFSFFFYEEEAFS